MKKNKDTIKNLQDNLSEDLKKIAKKYNINFVFGTVITDFKNNKCHFIGGAATKGKYSRHDLIDMFEASSRLYQSQRESMKKHLDYLN